MTRSTNTKRKRRARVATGVPCESGRRVLRVSPRHYAIEMQTPSGLMLVGYEIWSRANGTVTKTIEAN